MIVFALSVSKLQYSNSNVIGVAVLHASSGTMMSSQSWPVASTVHDTDAVTAQVVAEEGGLGFSLSPLLISGNLLK